MSYKIDDIVTLLNAEYRGEKIEEISKLSSFFHADEKSLTFAADEKFIKNLEKTEAKVIIVPDIDLPLNIGKSYIIVRENPRIIMPKLLNFFKRPLKTFEKMIEDSAKIGKNCNIAQNVYIGHDVEIGNNVTIYPNSTICEGTKIGSNTIIYSNVSIREFVEIGENCVIQPGAVIGSDGFGFIKVNGNNQKIDQIGSVVIEDNVEIGANTTIDRGAIGDTIIRKYTKIDNLVQIAHNDVIGENCLIISQVGIAGSTTVGNNVTLAGQVGVSGHITIGDNVVVGAKSGVSGNVEPNQILSGYPLVDHKEDLKIKVSLKKLPELLKRVKKLEEK
ncbi:UDP-3-O-(3-hydroxymyristoyl)glucosamine N-acyltransferase [Fusobacterium gastrosuis]|uniref:UDP-3-O-(3-hydroxymyristoyl)glucosamine N-acyltransferase n=1 Tax=Fusobacterium gastrosuis TaxID=1755100 RepID=UPI002977E890|nr:UDP-3-O-(3-hydroxymyristoyl)glucosamine N-acyltransferase [Fusobacteriaceae bacterium]MDY5305647.1 UDP-3-O-(3-hydroxymyristoyl)glucosamine N-acyltransferase [Fusobacterium gastrosuis]MDY5712483.1 UDP-3-O-(3-hydroxymyristoyl)glucosamine N-acyltransferase [Fusobacterium gastrosuis]